MEISRIALPALLILATGCGVIPDRSDQYQYEQRITPIKVPEVYSQNAIQDRYPVPKAQKAFVATGEFQVPSPPIPGAELLQDQFAIKSAGDDVWLSATEAPGRIWPALTRYWQESGGDLEQQDSAEGRLVCRLDNQSLKARQLADALGLNPETNPTIEASVVQGIKRNTSEVRVTVVSPQNASEAVELTILENMMVYLAENQAALESYSLAAQNLSGESRVEVISETENPYLRLDLGYERAWVAVGQALNAGSVPLVDLNRTKGEYLVNFIPGQEKKEAGWFDWLTGGDDDGVLSDEYNYSIRLIEVEGEGVKVEVSPTTEATSAQDRLALLNRILEHLS